MIVLAFMAVVVGLVLFGASSILKKNKTESGTAVRLSGFALFALGGALFIFSMFYVVNPGEVGVEVLFGSVKRYTENGLHAKNPFADVIIFDIKTQREEEKSEGASQDLQLVIVESVINYHLDASKLPELYSKVGQDFVHKVINPAVHESVKAAIARYKVEDVIVKRHEVKEMIVDSLRAKLASYYVVLEDVNIQDIDFSDEFNKVVEEKQIEEQKIKTAEYRRAQAEQDKQRVILEAQAEAEKQRLLKVNTSKEVVDLKWIEKWNGELPTTVMGNAVPMVNLGK